MNSYEIIELQRNEIKELKIIRDKLFRELQELEWPHVAERGKGNKWLNACHLEYCIDCQQYKDSREHKKVRLLTEWEPVKTENKP